MKFLFGLFHIQVNTHEELNKVILRHFSNVQIITKEQAKWQDFVRKYLYRDFIGYTFNSYNKSFYCILIFYL